MLVKGYLIFHRDGASIITSHYSRAFLDANFEWTRDWPAKSSVLNPVDNLWSIVSRAVFKDFKQYDTEANLIKAIDTDWKAFPDETLHRLLVSMPKLI